jgi:hypothetical protein
MRGITGLTSGPAVFYDKVVPITEGGRTRNRKVFEVCDVTTRKTIYTNEDRPHSIVYHNSKIVFVFSDRVKFAPAWVAQSHRLSSADTVYFSSRSSHNCLAAIASNTGFVATLRKNKSHARYSLQAVHFTFDGTPSARVLATSANIPLGSSTAPTRPFRLLHGREGRIGVRATNDLIREYTYDIPVSTLASRSQRNTFTVVALAIYLAILGMLLMIPVRLK